MHSQFIILYAFSLVNFGCDDLQDQEKLSEHLKLHVFTNHTGKTRVVLFLSSIQNVVVQLDGSYK